ncbi:DUF7504 family protein [Halosimplex salinum]|uniref:DUF7504 family protein n=1 Tax=Halosimplex salinum TaxID=1710538 RepID=UPI0013DE6D09|nr:hypothetical protein [Halosimplex salinum]
MQPGDNVLVMCPSFTGDESQVCLDLLTPVAPSDVNALSILFTQSPSDHLDAWQRVVGTYPKRSRIVTVDADARSNTSRSDESGESPAQKVDCVGSPQNLTRLGVRITDCLDGWADADPDRQVAVCFQSVSALLQYVELPQAFKFLNVVTERCEATEAVAHYHLDPHAHDDQTIETMLDLFDTVLAYEDGEWDLRRSSR